jgi:cysteine-rich repeat protein
VDEQCDDGNRIAGDGCSEACTRETSNGACGNGIVDSALGELCDDGNDDNGDACPDGVMAGTCEPARCGDGHVWMGVEECDPGADPTCRADCLDTVRCGNGLIDPGEGCDDGNGDNDDACPDGPGGTCEPARCGDGHLRDGVEICDDGDTDPASGCRADCLAMVGCGNGFLDVGEVCDDGNGENDDACPDGPGGTCEPARCGDGFMRAGVEQCDDGDGDNGDGCPDGQGGTCRLAFCGDGFKHAGIEECELGDTSCPMAELCTPPGQPGECECN